MVTPKDQIDGLKGDLYELSVFSQGFANLYLFGGYYKSWGWLFIMFNVIKDMSCTCRHSGSWVTIVPQNSSMVSWNQTLICCDPRRVLQTTASRPRGCRDWIEHDFHLFIPGHSFMTLPQKKYGRWFSDVFSEVLVPCDIFQMIFRSHTLEHWLA